MEFNKEEVLARCNSFCKGNLLEAFKISFVDATENSLVAKMLVSEVNSQIDGILHGGASAALAETVGSVATSVLVASADEDVRGIDIIMNHLRGVNKGVNVYATATCIHKGRTLQHWDIKITDEQNRLISYGKHTTICIAKR